MHRYKSLARFSSDLQREESIEAQVRAIKEFAEKNGYALQKVYADRGIRGTTDNRPQFQSMFEEVKNGGISAVIVHKYDRFARNTRDLLELIDILSQKEVEFVSKKEAIDTTTPTGKFMLTIFGAVSELERFYILSRQSEGIAIAKKQGKYKGRKPLKLPTETDTIIKKWKEGHITATEAMKKLGVSKSTFYRRFG